MWFFFLKKTQYKNKTLQKLQIKAPDVIRKFLAMETPSGGLRKDTVADSSERQYTPFNFKTSLTTIPQIIAV